jgi:hypothetical protein
MKSLAMRIALAALVIGTLSGCLDITPAGTLFASDPPGARVLVDGRDSGWVTPCMIDLDEEEAHQVSLELPGYAARTLSLQPARRVHFLTWSYGLNGWNVRGRFPLFLPTADLLLPFRENEALSPARIFVRLRPAEAPSEPAAGELTGAD